MDTEIGFESEIVQQAVRYLKKGCVVAIPTETVYGLAADARNEEAVRRIFSIKQRPIHHPLIVHIAHEDQLIDWAVDIPECAYRLARAFWPGPLTLVLKKAPTVLNIVTGGQNTIALRVPRHLITHEILKRWGGGVAAPSANRFGRISPTSAAHVRSELGDQVDLIVDGGDCDVGLESTILDLTQSVARILRPGVLTQEMLTDVLGKSVEYMDAQSKNVVNNLFLPRVPGNLSSHYAPRTETHLLDNVELCHFLVQHSRSQRIGVITCHRFSVEYKDKAAVWVDLSDHAIVFGQKIYAAMRRLDELDLDILLIERPPTGIEWEAIHDRLKRASSKIACRQS
jgi:L-threonylcarbamoyladenylate synthase